MGEQAGIQGTVMSDMSPRTREDSGKQNPLMSDIQSAEAFQAPLLMGGPQQRNGMLCCSLLRRFLETTSWITKEKFERFNPAALRREALALALSRWLCGRSVVGIFVRYDFSLQCHYTPPTQRAKVHDK